MLKVFKVFAKQELIRLSYTWTVLPVIAILTSVLWSYGVVTKDTEVPSFINWFITSFLLNTDKGDYTFLVVIIFFFLCWLLVGQYKISSIEKRRIRKIYIFLTQQFTNVVRVVSGAFVGFWILANFTDIVQEHPAAIPWSLYMLFVSLAVSYYSRKIFDLLITKST